MTNEEFHKGWTAEDFRQAYQEQITSRGHGSPFDRGSADSYYRRPYEPHWYPGGTRPGAPRVVKENMNDFELKEYDRGYEYNEELGDHKNW